MVEGPGIEPSSTALQAVAEITRLAHPPILFNTRWNVGSKADSVNPLYYDRFLLPVLSPPAYHPRSRPH